MPVVGNVYLLSKGVARLFNSGKLAGCVVSDELLNECERYAAGPDKGKQFFHELAAKQLAVFKGLGFAAGYLGGISKPETFGQIIDLAESYGPDDWRDFIREIQFSQPDEFFLFEHDPHDRPERARRGSTREYRRRLSQPPPSKEVTLIYRLSRWVHRMAFTRGPRAVRPVAAAFRPLGQEAGRLGRMVYGWRGVETAPVRLPGLRRLQPARVRLPLPAPRLFQERPQRALRRFGQWTLRTGRQGVLLGPRLRAAEGYGESETCSTARWRSTIRG